MTTTDWVKLFTASSIIIFAFTFSTWLAIVLLDALRIVIVAAAVTVAARVVRR